MAPPRWKEHKHATVIEPAKGTNAAKVECIHCSLRFWGGATRIRGHLTGNQCFGVSACEKVPGEVKNVMLALVKEKADREREKKRKLTLESSIMLSSPGFSQSTIPELNAGRKKELVIELLLGQTSSYICKLLEAVIDEIGVEDVVMIVTDSDSNCKLAGKLLTAQEKYTNITWVPCTAHIVDLFLEDVGKMVFVEEPIKECHSIANFIANHHAPHALYRQNNDLELSRHGDTRFVTNVLMMEQQIKSKTGMQKMCIGDEWAAATTSRRQEVLLNEKHWQRIGNLTAIFEPFVDLMRLVDCDTPVMGKIYKRCSDLKAHLAALKPVAGVMSARDIKDMQTAWRNRWNQLYSPLHAAGYALDPQFQLVAGHNEEVTSGLLEMVEKMLPKPEDQVKRNWSSYGFVHDRRRNRLTVKRAADLVYVHNNLCMLKRMRSIDCSEAVPTWASPNKGAALMPNDDDDDMVDLS
ncbi:hypothetical protein FOA52_003250 [Chlamydomonas sp. UWO 241]|nr:hypothetical protein FOA52_003250 [Chlamydomonas sp. UWO 241]